MDIESIKKLMTNNEGENLEFKESKGFNSMSILGGPEKNKRCLLGYCVALGNEGGGKLILGITEKKPRVIVGSMALNNKVGEAKIKIFNTLSIRIEIEELFEGQKRIVVITIPSRPIGRLLKFYGIPLMRVDEQLREMDDESQKKILNESKPDWSALICRNATLDDLDPKAITEARKKFTDKNKHLQKEIDSWDNVVFLNKAKLLIKGKVTNAAILLLGKKEAGALLSPAVAQITWILKDKTGIEKDYQHFFPPFLLSVNELYQKIRNLRYRYIKDGTLFPEEVSMYEPYLIREALNNCIAHQDYSLHSRIQVVENEEGYLIFTNKGDFIPGSIKAVIDSNSPQEYYKNKFLVDAMVNLNMIDTIGSGIKRMFIIQRNRFFPLPSYDLSNKKVLVTLYGKVLDLNYAKILAQYEDLSLSEIMNLDQIQKGEKISKIDAKELKAKSLIEGRYPNLYISEVMARKTGEMAKYIQNRPFQDEHYKRMILEFLVKNPDASRKDIDDLIMGVLPKILTRKQCKNKVSNLIRHLSTEKKIINKGNNKKPKWQINT